MTETPNLPLAPAWLTQARADHAEFLRRTTTTPTPRTVEPWDPRAAAIANLWQSWDLPLPYLVACDLIQAAHDHLGHTLEHYPHYRDEVIPHEPYPPSPHKAGNGDPRRDHPFTRYVQTNVFQWWAERIWIAVLGVEALRQTLDLDVPDWPQGTDPRL